MKTIKTILAVLVISAPLQVSAQDKGTAPAPTKVSEANTSEALKAVEKRKAELKSGADTRLSWEKKTGYERHKALSGIKGSRNVEIHLVTPTDGIPTGLVIAYGHVIPGPYNVESIDEKLLINGVQVKPSIVKARERKIKAATNSSDASAKAVKIERDVQDYYLSKIKTLPIADVKSKIADLISKSTDIYKNPEWLSDTALQVDLIGSSLQHTIRFSKSEAFVPSKRVTAEQLKKGEDSYVEMYKSMLRAGQTVVFLSNESEVGGENIREKVNPIMKEKGLTKIQRIEKLHSAGIDYDFAEDISDNYVSSEWDRK